MTLPLTRSINYSLPFLFIAMMALGFAHVSAFAEEPATTPTWTVPTAWVKQPGERAMRIATFIASADDTAIHIPLSSFPGEAGGLLDNINRWRGQVGLAAVTKENLMEGVTSFENPGMKIYTMRLKGATNHMLGGVIYDEANDRTWFIKATASATALDKHEKNFIAFAQSFKAGK
jgi:hypothetical protein